MAYDAHRQAAEGIAVRCAVITLSDTRDEQSDGSGTKIKDLLSAAGHSVGFYRVMRDDPATLQTVLTQLLVDGQVDAILTNGGTGISGRDQTINVIEKNLQTPLPGYGELFRMLSWEQIGSGAMMSRAVGGVAKGRVIFAMPGSTKAVELAMTRLILPELRHLVFELRKHAE